MFKWDGSSLGSHRYNIIESSAIIDNIKYAHIKLNNEETYAIYYRSDSLFPCIIDELKPLFGLIKLGTHSILIESKQFILVKVPTSSGSIITEVSVDKLDNKMSTKFQDMLKQVFIFRNLMGLSSSLKAIHIRFDKEWLPTSYLDHGYRSGRSSLNNNIITKYFGDSFKVYTRGYLKIQHGRQLSSSLSNWRSSIDLIVKRIDIGHIWISGNVINRMMSYQ